MPQLSLTTRQIKYIKAHWLQISGAAMARKFGVNRSVVSSYMRKNGLTVPHEMKLEFRSKPMKGRTTSDKETDRYLKENYLNIPVKTMAKNLKRSGLFARNRMKQLGLVVPDEIILQRKKESQFSKGNQAHNKGKKMRPEIYEKVKKTMFKPGHVTYNTYPEDGAISIRTEKCGRFYKYIRVSLGKWQLLHQYIYEQKHGKVPSGHCLWFIDGDSMNCTLENIELITRAENAFRNRQKHLQLPEELKQTIKTIRKIKRKIKQNEHKKQAIRP